MKVNLLPSIAYYIPRSITKDHATAAAAARAACLLRIAGNRDKLQKEGEGESVEVIIVVGAQR